VVAELGGRYSPEHLAASACGGRMELAGWIIDRAIGTETYIDEGAAKLESPRYANVGYSGSRLGGEWKQPNRGCNCGEERSQPF
jgi:hypothetical protein